MTTQRLTLIFPLNNSFSFSKRTFLYLILLLISGLVISLLIFYILQVEELTRENYLIESYNEKIEILKENNLSFGEQQTESLCLKNIEKKIETLDLVKVSEVKYIPISYDYLVRETH